MTIVLVAGSAISQEKCKTIHVYVALCDNENQGIIPVPKKLGNGKDLQNNLYWGALYGVKSYFKNSKEWILLSSIQKPSDKILERCIFRHKNKNIYLIADAYEGSKIKQTIIDFLNAASGKTNNSATIALNNKFITIAVSGSSDLIVYVGHDGLMDFQLDLYPQKENDKKREVMILACYSKRYFQQAVKESGAYPLLWTSGLMAPEAYSLKSAIDGWILNEENEKIRLRAVREYQNYQKCSFKGANNLFKTGW